MSARNICSTSRSICVTRSMAPFFSTRRWSMPASCMAPARVTAWTAVARNFGEIDSGTGGELLDHAHFHAPLGHARELHIVHEAAHEEDAASARLEDVLGREGVGDGLGLESLALVGDAHDQLRRLVDRGEGEFDGDDFGGI